MSAPQKKEGIPQGVQGDPQTHGISQGRDDLAQRGQGLVDVGAFLGRERRGRKA